MVKFEPDFDTTFGKPYGSISVYIGMISSTLGLSFVEVFSKKTLYQLDVIHVYILVSFPIPTLPYQCGTCDCETLGTHPIVIFISFSCYDKLPN